MNLHDRAAYEALRAYLTNLLLNPRDRPLASVPSPLRPDLEAFLLGKTLYHDVHDQPVVCTATTWRPGLTRSCTRLV